MRSGMLLLALLAATAGADTVYRSVDEAGRPVFSDQPEKGAKAVDLPPTNTVEPVVPRPAEPAQPAAFAGYDRVHLAVPEIVPNGLAPFDVSIETSPALRPGHRWRLLIDGALVSEQTDTTYTVEQLSRGSHTAVAEVVGANGEMLGESVAVDFFVYWPGGGR